MHDALTRDVTHCAEDQAGAEVLLVAVDCLTQSIQNLTEQVLPVCGCLRPSNRSSCANCRLLLSPAHFLKSGNNSRADRSSSSAQASGQEYVCSLRNDTCDQAEADGAHTSPHTERQRAGGYNCTKLQAIMGSLCNEKRLCKLSTCVVAQKAKPLDLRR